MIKDLLNKTKTSISFEVFPPKKEDEFQDVFSKLDALAVLKPDFISLSSLRSLTISSYLSGINSSLIKLPTSSIIRNNSLCSSSTSQFTNACLIGVEEIDNEHRELFRLIEEAHNLLENIRNNSLCSSSTREIPVLNSSVKTPVYFTSKLFSLCYLSF